MKDTAHLFRRELLTNFVSFVVIVTGTASTTIDIAGLNGTLDSPTVYPDGGQPEVTTVDDGFTLFSGNFSGGEAIKMFT